MRVVHISTHDQNGGAAIAASRLHRGLRASGIDSRMLVADKTGGDPHTVAVHNNFTYSLRRNLDGMPLRLERVAGSIGWRSLAWLPNWKLERALAELEPDLVHVHWAQNGFLPLSAMARFAVPVVWTFHDMWPVCGAFHHEYDADWRNPYPYDRKNRPAGRRGPDLDRRVWRRKRALYERVTIDAVVPSRWMAERVRESALWRGREVTVVANGLDTNVFKPIDKVAARDLFNLSRKKTIILFGAMYAGGDKNKGYAQLRDALKALDLPAGETELAVFGMSEPLPGDPPLPYRARWLGVLRDPQSLAALYSAADVMVVPSLQESFGQTASEPLACATPVVAFDTSGLKDVIDHRVNGYLAKPFDPVDLAAGINWVLEDGSRYRDLCAGARKKAERAFAIDVVSARYGRRYDKLLATASPIAAAATAQV